MSEGRSRSHQLPKPGSFTTPAAKGETVKGGPQFGRFSDVDSSAGLVFCNSLKAARTVSDESDDQSAGGDVK